MDSVLAFLGRYKYLAMAGILFLCGLGLPVPEELTLVGSGLLVGWNEAEFLPALLACTIGILAGDSIIFGLGYALGDRLLRNRFMRLLIHPRRRRKVEKLFQRHGNKTVFFARFLAGVRVGVYAYTGSRRMGWGRFLLLDFLGVLISVPLTLVVGRWAARTFAGDAAAAQERALAIVREAGHWIAAGIVAAVVAYVAFRYLIPRYRRSRGAKEHGDEKSATRRPASTSSAPGGAGPGSSSCAR